MTNLSRVGEELVFDWPIGGQYRYRCRPIGAQSFYRFNISTLLSFYSSRSVGYCYILCGNIFRWKASLDFYFTSFFILSAFLSCFILFFLYLFICTCSIFYLLFDLWWSIFWPYPFFLIFCYCSFLFFLSFILICSIMIVAFFLNSIFHAF